MKKILIKLSIIVLVVIGIVNILMINPVSNSNSNLNNVINLAHADGEGSGECTTDWAYDYDSEECAPEECNNYYEWYETRAQCNGTAGGNCEEGIRIIEISCDCNIDGYDGIVNSSC